MDSTYNLWSRRFIPKGTLIGYLSPIAVYFPSVKMMGKKKCRFSEPLCFQLKTTGECLLTSTENEIHYSILHKWKTRNKEWCNIILKDDSSIYTLTNINGVYDNPVKIIGYMGNYRQIDYYHSSRQVVPKTNESMSSSCMEQKQKVPSPLPRSCSKDSDVLDVLIDDLDCDLDFGKVFDYQTKDTFFQDDYDETHDDLLDGWNDFDGVVLD